ncbi:alpha/beta fold hydrolase [Flavobacterium sp. 3HN19-14]|uniref:alpha/beta fold hydrolase n=1 Tax=Flavobacterium sp. 3HN19-14 TaxID=3448133 RepID=UPI003EDE94B7
MSTYRYFTRNSAKIGTAPVVLVNHALTGNSNVSGETGWWKDLIGDNKTINTRNFTVIAFNIPGNGFDINPDNLIFNYKDYTVRDIAGIFWEGLRRLKIENLFAVIGGSLGGAIAWEISASQPKKVTHLIPIATDWKSTDWLIANVKVQDNILNNSDQPIADARQHAMLLYRTPQSFNQKFHRQQEYGNYSIENWLFNHGEKLKSRFRLSSYKLMNHLLKTIDITQNRTDFKSLLQKTETNIHLIAVDTDALFTADQTLETYEILKPIKKNITYHEIKSIHGHDAFLIEFEQLSSILNPIFQIPKQQNGHYRLTPHIAKTLSL